MGEHMYCKKCGAKIENEAVFCAGCGTKINDSDIASVEAPDESVAYNKGEAAFSPELSNEKVTDKTDKTADSQKISLSAKKDGFGVASLILGIFSLISNATCGCCCGYIGLLPPIASSILGLVFSSMALKKAKEEGYKNKIAAAAKILCIIAICIIITILILYAIEIIFDGMSIISGFKKQFEAIIEEAL